MWNGSRNSRHSEGSCSFCFNGYLYSDDSYKVWSLSNPNPLIYNRNLYLYEEIYEGMLLKSFLLLQYKILHYKAFLLLTTFTFNSKVCNYPIIWNGFPPPGKKLQCTLLTEQKDILKYMKMAGKFGSHPLPAAIIQTQYQSLNVFLLCYMFLDS